MSVPISEMIVCAVMTLNPSIEVRSTPQILFSSAFRFTVGSLRVGFFVFRSFFTFWVVAAGRALAGYIQDSGRQAGQKTFELPVALLHLLVRKMEAVHCLPEFKYQIVAPVAFQTARYLFPAGPHHLVSQVRQFPGISFAFQDCGNDRLTTHPADIADHVG